MPIQKEFSDAASDESILNCLGNDLDSLESKVSAAVFKKLVAYDSHTTADFYLPAIDCLFLAHNLGGKSHTDLAKEIGIGKSTVRKIFLLYGLPIVGRAEAAKRKWDDPEFRYGQAEASRAAIYKLKKDPEFLKKEAAARSATFHNLWDNDPDFANKVAERARGQCHERWKDVAFRQRQRDGIEKELERRWKDPEFRTRFAETHAESTQRLWEDSQFKEKIAEAARDARYRPEGLASKVHIPAIHGYRRDIRFYAQSTWEANLARVLMYNHANLSRRQTFQLRVPETHREAVGLEKTELTVDFAVRDARGRVTLYEIMAHPLEDPVGRVKFELLQRQFPQFRVIAVDKTHYETLRKQFAAKINSSGWLCGWETKQDNLRTNPVKYA